jgi:hypothetical protein
MKTLALVLGLPPVLAAALSLVQCNSDGITPVCPPAGGDCVTPPGTSSASVVPGSAGGTGAGAGGANGSAGSVGTAGSSAAGSGGDTTDGGLLSLLDAALDIRLGQ